MFLGCPSICACMCVWSGRCILWPACCQLPVYLLLLIILIHFLLVFNLCSFWTLVMPSQSCYVGWSRKTFLYVYNVIYLCFYISFLLSVLWHCWLGARNSIRPVKIEWWGVDVVICLDQDADCLHMVQLMPLHPKTPSSLASFKSRVALHFWYQLTQVVLEKRLLNGCSVVVVVVLYQV